MTSPTFSPRTATRSVPFAEQEIVKLAFQDELVKIAEAVQGARKKAIAKWVKTTLAISAGTAAGTGALMLGERAASSLLKKSWNKLSPQSRMLILGAGASAAALGANHLAKKMLDRKRREES
jgi:hypothetical protein